MTKAAELREFLNFMKEQDDKCDSLLNTADSLFGCSIESPFFEYAWGYSDALLKMAEKYFDDKYDLISWFIYDNSFGREKLEYDDVVIDSIDTFIITCFK